MHYKKIKKKMLEGSIIHEHYPKYLENPIVSAKSTLNLHKLNINATPHAQTMI